VLNIIQNVLQHHYTHFMCLDHRTTMNAPKPCFTPFLCSWKSGLK